MVITRRALSFISMLLLVGLVTTPCSLAVASTQTDIVGPTGSEAFGSRVIVLSNGNFVVIDPYYDDGSTADVGAVYLYDGRSGELISMLTGSTADDRVGYDGAIALTNGNYVVSSRYWDNGGVVDAGAVTWGDGTTGVAGVVSQINSLVGSTTGDQVGLSVTALTNGNYVVQSSSWDNGAMVNVGAVTWGSGTSGIAGVVSEANSLVGSTADDYVGNDGVTALDNGNYIVFSLDWDNDGVDRAGAVTWGDGTSGVAGAVSAANSLVGGTADDQVGSGGVTILTNGNYVISSPWWDNDGVADTAAVTWGDGTSGVSGAVSAANSLVGSTLDDNVGSGGVTALANGNYVVISNFWDNLGLTDVGAVTWGDGATGVAGEISAANSLVGSTADDQIGRDGVTALTNGSYVVSSPDWDYGGVINAGAVTWGDGTTGLVGAVSVSNSLVGSTALDYVGSGVQALTNGNYVVSSPYWDNGVVLDAGAVTWGDGSNGITGEVSLVNSLVGGTAGDHIGYIVALTNGNYVVRSPGWDNGGVVDAGAVTWGDGATGLVGDVSESNSLVGGKDNDRVGSGWGTPLTNGNYVVISRYWDNGWIMDVGAVTWVDGTNGMAGVVSAANSLVGGTTGDQVGKDGVIGLANGNFVVRSYNWDNGVVVDAGAVTWGDGTSGITGVVSESNSLVGGTANDRVGSGGVMALTNGNYVVRSSGWDYDTFVDAGAVTWGDGASGVTGLVSAVNSLVGSTVNDTVGSDGVTALTDGSYVVRSPSWDNSPVVDAGAVTWGDVNFPAIGVITADNSVRGTSDGGGGSLNFAYDDLNQQLVVGRPQDDIVTLFRLNLFPLADAGPNQTVMSAATVTLDGSSSSDPDGGLPLTYAWTQSGGTAVTLSSSSSAQPSFTAPVVTQTSVLTFTLVVSDSLGLSSLPDQVAITVEPYPIADAGPDQTVMSGANVTLDGGDSYDPDGDLPLTYAWSQSGGTAVALSSSSAVQPSFAAPDVTQTSVLTFTLVVSDSLGLSSLPDQVAITVEPYSARLPVILNRVSP